MDFRFLGVRQGRLYISTGGEIAGRGQDVLGVESEVFHCWVWGFG